MSDSQLRPTTHVLLAFAIVYVVWGSTYLAIRIGVHDAPAILFAGLRFLIAAGPMFVYAYWRGARLPKARRDWAVITITALLMLVGANGQVTWEEHTSELQSLMRISYAVFCLKKKTTTQSQLMNHNEQQFKTQSTHSVQLQTV